MKRITFFRRPAAAAAALAICVCALGTTAFASGAKQGFFADVFGKHGAVVSTVYEQASDELELTVIEAGDNIMVELTVLFPDQFPFREIEAYGIGSYQILDETNTVIAEGAATKTEAIAGNKAQLSIPVDPLPAGAYTLVVSELVGTKKAEQSLPLTGHWECGFTR